MATIEHESTQEDTPTRLASVKKAILEDVHERYYPGVESGDRTTLRELSLHDVDRILNHAIGRLAGANLLDKQIYEDTDFSRDEVDVQD